MKITENGLLFESSGKVIDYPEYGGYVGIHVNDDDIEITAGYDSVYHDVNDNLTKEEREEFAAFMISRWTTWKNTPIETP